MENKSLQDVLYAQSKNKIDHFVFDESVANVFNDMIQRSVPGYGAIINMIGVLAGIYVQDNSVCYDLGCSLGASTLAMRDRIDKLNCKIIAVDNSQAMIDKCRQNITDEPCEVPVEVICKDIRDVAVQNASMVVLNFTLQFLRPEQRDAIIGEIYRGIRQDGILVISEKIVFENEEEQKCQTQLYHNFKRLNGYSELEIAQKRSALENVLIPDTLSQHKRRLECVGFKQCHVWFQCFNFVSIVAVK